MKVTNYQSCNYVYFNTDVVRGSITMTRAEFNDAIKYLKDSLEEATRICNTYTRDCLRMTFAKQHPLKKASTMLGVHATELIFAQYSLLNYKKQNYQILIRK